MSESRPRRPRAWHTEERARLMLDSIGDFAVFMLDPDGYIETWNRGATRIEGYAVEEIVGRHFSRLYSPEDVAAGKPESHLMQARERGRYEEEGWRVRKDGSRFWANIVLSVMRDGSGRLEGFANVTCDVSESHRARDALRIAEQRFRLLVESVQDYAIFRLDPAGRIATWNLGAERIEGYPSEEIVGQHFSKFFAPEDIAAGKPDAELRVASESGRCEDEGWRVRKDGSRFWAHVVVTSLRSPSGELCGFAKVTRDVTLQREAEAERLRRARAEEAVRLRDEFLSVVSHELKTPLASLQMQLQSIRRSGLDLTPGVARKVARATKSATRLGELVAELLDTSRLATHHFELDRRPFALADAVRDVVDRVRERATDARCGVMLHIEAEARGVWDRLRIEQVITNLVSNAIKFGAAAPISVALAVEDGYALLTVDDAGPGIADDALSRIFDRFERAASTQNYGGLGLGLYISREIVIAHGGSISVDNLPAGGARFTVRLPLASGMDDHGSRYGRTV